MRRHHVAISAALLLVISGGAVWFSADVSAWVDGLTSGSTQVAGRTSVRTSVVQSEGRQSLSEDASASAANPRSDDGLTASDNQGAEHRGAADSVAATTAAQSSAQSAIADDSGTTSVQRVRATEPVEVPASSTSSSSREPLQASDAYRPTLIPQPLEPVPGAGVRVTERIDLGFPFDPVAYPEGTMRLHNESSGPVAVSFHGDDVSHVRLNGQPVEAGRKYLLQGEAEVRADRHVGVHLRSLDGTEKLPAPDGPG
jgi:hypothetical protein